MHALEKKITLNAAPEEVWAFLATPLNLDELTPPDLEFRILSDLPDKMYNGLMITYEIRIPLLRHTSLADRDQTRQRRCQLCR